MSLKPLAIVLLVTGLALATPAYGPAQGGLRIGQLAPEITGSPWLNSEPLSIQKLRGRVVLVEFWTYG